MIRYSKLFLYLTTTVLLAWLLPWCWDFFTLRPAKTPFALYSPVIGDFALIQSTDSGTLRTDRKGQLYSASAFDSILPFFYYRQLITDNKFPDTIKGRPVTPQTVRQENFMFRHTPSDLNRIKVPLYPLLESMSGRVDLEMPDDVFRIRNGIEFLDSKTNRIKKEKSETYQHIFRKKGFRFPARFIEGHPTIRKEYDEGYFIIDHDFDIFHLKQTVGRPFLRKITLPSDFRIKNIFITEFRNRKTFAFLTDENGKFYSLQRPDYTLRAIPLDSFVPEKESMAVTGDPFVWTFAVTGKNGTTVYAIDAETYELLDKMFLPAPVATGAGKIADFLFPFRLAFTSSLDKEIYPHLNGFSFRALPLNLLLALLFFLFRKKKGKTDAREILFLLIGGLYAWIGLSVFETD